MFSLVMLVIMMLLLLLLLLMMMMMAGRQTEERCNSGHPETRERHVTAAVFCTRETRYSSVL